VLRTYALGPEDDPLSTIADELKRQHDRREAVEDIDIRVRAGELPLGMLAAASDAATPRPRSEEPPEWC
jgi:hypothetical protein